MKRHYVVSSSLLTRQAHVSDYAADSTARGQRAMAFTPNDIEFIQESFVVLDMTELPGMISVIFEGPIWR